MVFGHTSWTAAGFDLTTRHRLLLHFELVINRKIFLNHNFSQYREEEECI